MLLGIVAIPLTNSVGEKKHHPFSPNKNSIDRRIRGSHFWRQGAQIGRSGKGFLECFVLKVFVGGKSLIVVYLFGTIL